MTEERTSPQPSNRRPTDVVGFGDSPIGFTLLTSGQGLPLLERGQGRLTSELDAVGFRPCPAFGSPGADQLSFKFRQPTEDSQHQSAVRGGAVGPNVAQGPERGTFVGDSRQRVQQVSGGPSKPVEPRHHQHVPGRHLADELPELDTISLRPGRSFPKNFPAPGRLELGDLAVEALGFGGDAGIAVKHRGTAGTG